MRTVFLGLVVCLSGCGYQTGSMMPGGVVDVAVQMFANETRPETRYRAAEATFTRFLTRELVRRAHVRLRDPEDSQAIIKGTIVRMDRTTLVEDENDQLTEGGILATVRVEMVDSTTGEPLMAPFEVTRRAAHINPRPETLEDAVNEVMEEVAQEAVIRIQAEPFLRSRPRDRTRSGS